MVVLRSRPAVEVMALVSRVPPLLSECFERAGAAIKGCFREICSFDLQRGVRCLPRGVLYSSSSQAAADRVAHTAGCYGSCAMYAHAWRTVKSNGGDKDQVE